MKKQIISGAVALAISSTMFSVAPDAAAKKSKKTTIDMGEDEDDDDIEVVEDAGLAREAAAEEEERALADEAAKEEAKSKQGRPSPLDAELGLRLYSRAFRYTDTREQLFGSSFEPMLDYNLTAAPMPYLNVNWYPMAHFSGGFASHIGLSGGFEYGLATTAVYQNDAGEENRYRQQHQVYHMGARGRIPLSWATFGVDLEYVSDRSVLKGSGGERLTTLFPNVKYSSLELGADVEFQVGDVLLRVGAAYLINLGVGEIGGDEWFPNASASGVHLGGHVGYVLSPTWALLGHLDMRAYGLDFNPVSPDRPDTRVAGGATDRYLSASFAVRFTLPGVAAPGADAGGGEGGGDDSDGFDDFDDF